MAAPRRTVVAAYLTAFAAIGVAIVVGALAGAWARCRWGAAAAGVTLALQLVSTGIVLAATLGFLVDVETWKQQSPAEKLNRV